MIKVVLCYMYNTYTVDLINKTILGTDKYGLNMDWSF